MNISRSAGRCVPDVQGIRDKKKVKLTVQKLRLVLKFLVFFPLSTNNILAFVEDFKSIPVPSKEISSLAVEQIFEILTLLYFPLVVLLCTHHLRKPRNYFSVSYFTREPARPTRVW